ncbi:MAG: hypothetical protein R6V12_15610 [Candidatus Hydrogenedentota bacterium]
MKRIQAIVFGISFGCLLAMAGCERGQEKIAEIPPTDLLLAAEIMDRAVATYEECTTYRDTGTMVRTFYGEEGTQREMQTFTTAFERPYRFRFECREDEKRYIVYADAAAVRSWWGAQEGIQPMNSLDEAIARAVGASNGASHTIPRLLMPERVRGRSLAELRELDRLSDALLGDVPCYRLAGIDNSGAPYVIWLERATFLVLRIDEQHTFADFTTTDRTVYSPDLNVELPDDVFQLKAPAPESGRKEVTARAF